MTQTCKRVRHITKNNCMSLIVLFDRGVSGCMVTEKVAIVIPALNEEAAIHQLLAELPQDFAQWVIVVDNGSTDATATVAQRCGAIVATEPMRGYGRSCLKGFKTAYSL